MVKRREMMLNQCVGSFTTLVTSSVLRPTLAVGMPSISNRSTGFYSGFVHEVSRRAAGFYSGFVHEVSRRAVASFLSNDASRVQLQVMWKKVLIDCSFFF